MQKGINTSFLDPSIDPANDLYAFVNGGWMETNEIPDDRSSWGSFHELAQNTDQKILTILENELAIQGPAENLAARLFESGMDRMHIEKAKLEALENRLIAIASVKHIDELPSLIGMLIKSDIGGLIQISVHPDLGNSQIYSTYLEPGTLGLPEENIISTIMRKQKQ